MTSMYRYRYLMTHFTGEPGYITFYSDPVLVDTSFFREFFATFINYWPHGLTIQSPTDADVVEVETGNVLGTVAVLAQPDQVSTLPAQPFAGMAGAFIDWSCAPARVHNRVVRGRTFLVPFDPSVFDNNGKLAPTQQGQLQSAASTLLTAVGPHLGIWARPYGGRAVTVRPGKTTLPAIPPRLGTFNLISSAKVPFMQATLRSRRT